MKFAPHTSTGPLLPTVLALALTTACGESQAAAGISPPTDPSDRVAATAFEGTNYDTLVDAKLAPFREDLLRIAFEAASKLPSDKDVKDRSRAQERVVEACLELGQPKQAVAYADGIENWRRGAAYANVAATLLESGVTGVDGLLDGAYEIATEAAANEEQRWRVGRILAQIVRAAVARGDEVTVEQLAPSIDVTEMAPVAALKAELLPDSGFESTLANMDELLALGEFARAQGALEMGVALFERFFADAEKRDAVFERFGTVRKTVPAAVQIEFYARLAEVALAHDDEGVARKCLAPARELEQADGWRAEFRVPIKARIAEVLGALGDTKVARAELEESLELFTAERRTIVQMFRPGVLLPVAEAYFAMADVADAQKVYRKALEEGAVNPNARPRMNMLVEVCVSMARAGIEPDGELFGRIVELRDGLRDPW